MASQSPDQVTTAFTSKRRNENFPDVDDVDANELWQRRDSVAIIDVRRPDEYTGELGHVPGARLLTLDTLPQRMDELPKQRTIVFVCRSGQRSARAAQFAKEQGLSDVYNMAGGMLRWNELGLKTETADPEVR